MTDGLDPIAGATVILVEGSQSANPQNLTAYMTTTDTLADGSWSMKFEATGTKTVYVVKSGYKHLSKAYNFQELDQNIQFPEAALDAV